MVEEEKEEGGTVGVGEVEKDMDDQLEEDPEERLISNRP